MGRLADVNRNQNVNKSIRNMERSENKFITRIYFIDEFPGCWAAAVIVNIVSPGMTNQTIPVNILLFAVQWAKIDKDYCE